MNNRAFVVIRRLQLRRRLLLGVLILFVVPRSLQPRRSNTSSPPKKKCRSYASLPSGNGSACVSTRSATRKKEEEQAQLETVENNSTISL